MCVRGGQQQRRRVKERERGEMRPGTEHRMEELCLRVQSIMRAYIECHVRMCSGLYRMEILQSKRRFFQSTPHGSRDGGQSTRSPPRARDCARASQTHCGAALRVPRTQHPHAPHMHTTPARATCTQGCTSTSLTTVLSKRGEHTAHASAKHQNSKRRQHLSIAPCCTCTSSSLLMCGCCKFRTGVGIIR